MEKQKAIFKKKSLNDNFIISPDVGKIGYEFCDETIEIFYGFMQQFINNPIIKDKSKERWKEFVKRSM